MRAMFLVAVLGGLLYCVFLLNEDLISMGAGKQEANLAPSRAAEQVVTGLKRHEADNKAEVERILNNR